jgi:L-lactate dehydrogenase (cytochrome)
VLDILRGGIDSALVGLARASVHDLNPDDVLVPPGFARVLGNSVADNVADNEESPPRVGR